ncbi:lipoyl(octanoyl) transferase LipB [Candidatus Tachikawaea gelatinosa]|uniref:Octanoyltransferase n=1 Tax=Candidatus Tachikawaea gelatinosa TaxID=1410383 RepID=A0A090AJ77_9ENTR|nr:lipoyl(octanoyl) transferase LipB [Candidatus Tachikawaea gelatinosa]BAP58493.1 octanoyltransferase [Candidatus Tachikawaea gelatinosa]
MKNNILFVREHKFLSWDVSYQAMHDFTENRHNYTPDEIWLLEHPSIFTTGQSLIKEKNFKNIKNIPVTQSDRGGKITYHGPGQQIVYFLLNLKRINLNIRQLVSLLENTIISTLLYFDIKSVSKINAPGVYIKKKKICSIGLKIRKGYSMHGLSLNVKMDLSPFSFINPCGYNGLKMTQISDFNNTVTMQDIQPILIRNFLSLAKLCYKKTYWLPFER